LLIVDEGFTEERINAVLHQIEIDQRHVVSNFGLNLSASIMHSWIHGGSPFETLSVYQIVEKIKIEIFKKK